MQHDVPQARISLGLGIDAGGTGTRWALAEPSGKVSATGSVAGLTALMMGSEAGRDQIGQAIRQLSSALHEVLAGRIGPDGGQPPQMPQRVFAGFTAYSEDPPLRARIEALVANALDLPAERVCVCGDIALAYLDCFEPAAGYLVYAGTGSIAAYIDVDGRLHRAGGRGGLLDDGGSGYWIAREAMRHIWRAEDEQPGNWRGSALAASVFEHVGGSEWARSRDFFYQGTRGQVGEMAQAVAVAAVQGDAVALRLLARAGAELARLATALTRRFGTRPIVLAGRAVQLHPAIEQGMREALGPTVALRAVRLHAHKTAARLAANDAAVMRQLVAAELAAVQETAGPRGAGDA